MPTDRDSQIPRRTPLGGADRLTAALKEAADRARTAESALGRSRTGWLRRQAEEESTLASVLVGLAERGETVVVETDAGRRHRGVVGLVGADVVGLGEREQPTVLVRIAAVRSIRTTTAVSGQRATTLSVEPLASILSSLAGSRERVRIVAGSGDPLTGTLVSVGRDLLTLRLDADPPALAYVALSSVSEVSLAASG